MFMLVMLKMNAALPQRIPTGTDLERFCSIPESCHCNCTLCTQCSRTRDLSETTFVV
jgi:hypothetical protein